MKSIIEQLYQLDEKDSQVLYSGAHAEVRQYQHYRWLSMEGDLIQSVMDLELPEKLLNPVNIYMLAGLYLRPAPATVLNLGFGGGVFERFFTRHYPGICVHSVDNDETVIHLAREFFSIAPDYPVYLQSAENFVKGINGEYGLILCDIFSAERHSSCLFTGSFYRDCRQCLVVGGLLILNLVPKDQDELLQVLQPLRKSFRHTSLLEIPEHSNVIVFASDREFHSVINYRHLKQLPGLHDLSAEHFFRMLEMLPDPRSGKSK